jgi:hypothetical protein
VRSLPPFAVGVLCARVESELGPGPTPEPVAKSPLFEGLAAARFFVPESSGLGALLHILPPPATVCAAREPITV